MGIVFITHEDVKSLSSRTQPRLLVGDVSFNVLPFSAFFSFTISYFAVDDCCSGDNSDENSFKLRNKMVNLSIVMWM